MVKIGLIIVARPIGDVTPIGDADAIVRDDQVEEVDFGAALGKGAEATYNGQE